jgi:hypothetical protein
LHEGFVPATHRSQAHWRVRDTADIIRASYHSVTIVVPAAMCTLRACHIQQLVYATKASFEWVDTSVWRLALLLGTELEMIECKKSNEKSQSQKSNSKVKSQPAG